MQVFSVFHSMKNRLHLQRKSCFVLRKKCQIGENSLRNRTRNMKKHGRCKSICRAKIRFCPHTPRRGPQMNLKRSANATVREIFSHGPGEVRTPSLRQRPLSALQRLCDALTQSVLMTAAPLSFHCNIRFVSVILAEIPCAVNFRAVKRRWPGCRFFVRINKNSTGSSPRRSAP